MYSNGMLLKEINDCIESFELFLDAISTNKLLLEDDLLEIKLQFAKLKSCDSFLLLKNLRRPSKVGKLTTIVHGELWDRNVLLNDTYQVIVLDWKNAKLASATLDLAFLMLSSTTWYVSALLHIAASCKNNNLFQGSSWRCDWWPSSRLLWKILWKTCLSWWGTNFSRASRRLPHKPSNCSHSGIHIFFFNNLLIS